MESDNSELISDDPRKSKNIQNAERKIELIKLAENSTINGFSVLESVWTVNKADLISKYLWAFLSITKNGIYIDAFSGPQSEECDSQSWTAEKVLNMGSVFLKKAYLFDQSDSQISYLETMVEAFEERKLKYSPRVFVNQGDSNEKITEILTLPEHQIGEKNAVLSLLDQRTSECSWELVKKMAALKPSSEGTRKVEIFYFLAQGWLDRAVLSRSTVAKIEETNRWWGGEDWQDFLKLSSDQRALVFCEKFRDLGYKFCQSYGMRAQDGRVMFWLIHATDHERAPHLMKRAYSAVCRGLTDEEWQQATEELFEEYK